ncbi:MAG: ABC transporter permease, partial [Verrucomicrobia bacterium]|nr:ABC transporter permease [Cytophagales bacterium]
LLNVLNGNKEPQQGKVLINGLNIYQDKEDLKGVIGYVPQDDLLVEELTVYENLYFAARLCFAKMPEATIDKLVINTLHDLGLTEAKDLRVGNVLDKTISGGQRKRVNIGLELLREPSVLFVDEPTSGLSSKDSENIIDLLKELTFAGKLIFVVIHQPSSDIFKLFDKLIVMDKGGHQIYYGNPVESVVYFKSLTNQVNADVALCAACGNVNPEQIFDIIETKVVDEYGRETDERKYTPEDWRDYFEVIQRVPKLIPAAEKPLSTLRVPNKVVQWFLFTWRDLLSKLNDRQYLVINLVQAPVLALLLGYIVRFYKIDELTSQGEYIFAENLNVPAFLFMSIIVSLFMGLTLSAEEIIKDAKILKREKFLNLSRSSYLFSKMGILFSFSALQSFLYTIIGTWIVGIEGMNWIYWGVLFSVSCFANMVGLNISQTFKTVVTIYILIPILLIPQLILGGIVVKFDQINPDMYGQDNTPLIGDLMASRWAFEALMVSQFMENPYEKPFYETDKQKAHADYKKNYFLTTLSAKTAYCANAEDKKDETFIKYLRLLKREIKQQMQEVPTVKLAVYEQLNPEKFTKSTAQALEKYYQELEKYYNQTYIKVVEERDAIISGQMRTEEQRKAFLAKKLRFHNERVEDLVTNTVTDQRIVEYEGKLVHKIYPIFFNPDSPANSLDYRSHFYAPVKHIFGYYVPTLYFNIGVIWVMSLLLYITLYFKTFRWLLSRGKKAE